MPDDRSNTSQGLPDFGVPAQKGAFPRHIGRTKGGLNSKLHAVYDGRGRPVRLHLTAGQVSTFKGADVLLADLPDGTEEVIGDRGYDSNRIGLSLTERTITACIHLKNNRKSKPPYNWHLYKKRHLIENIFAKLKRLKTDGYQIRPLRPYNPRLQSTSQQASSSISKNEPRA